MNNFVHGIQQFKTQWQRRNVAAPAVPDEIEEMVRMYKAVGPAQDATRLAFERRWDKLPEARRKALVDELLRTGDLPPIVAEALTIFNGTVERLV